MVNIGRRPSVRRVIMGHASNDAHDGYDGHSLEAVASEFGRLQPAWTLDLVLAGLGSVGCNGLAALLLVFAAHALRAKSRDLGQPRHLPPTVDLGWPRPTLELLEPSLGNIDAFMLARVVRISGAQVSWAELFAEYLGWCRADGFAPVTVEKFGSQMDAIRRELKLRTRAAGDDVYFVGLGINRLRLVAS